ncbi:unnamed protein product [Danaus chrysippus]|uniref:(African queen) hypothetical protein n=1 Tax=Danaus chrysippus TaxID=151541 RepID=A0A8J2R4P2_9NEOP|nr:unnamed protein product [Danaus chrysippus]
MPVDADYYCTDVVSPGCELTGLRTWKDICLVRNSLFQHQIFVCVGECVCGAVTLIHGWRLATGSGGQPAVTVGRLPLHDPDTERSISCTAIGVAAFADTASDAYTQIIIRCRGALDCDLWTLCDKRVQYTDSAIILTLLFKK